MIINPNNPMQALDKYGNPKDMTNPYGTFHTNLSYVNKLNARITQGIDNLYLSNIPKNSPSSVLAQRIAMSRARFEGPQLKYSQSLLKQAYSNLHPRQGVTVTLNSQIDNMKENQIEYYANEAGKYLKQIHDSDNVNLSPERVWNLPDIVKYHEYSTDKTGRSHISDDQFLDLAGKSDNHIKWDADFWYRRAIGIPNDDRSKAGQQVKNNDKNAQNAMNIFNKWAQVYDRLITQPNVNWDANYVTREKAQKYMDSASSALSYTAHHGSNSWLMKIKQTQLWMNYHRGKLNAYKADPRHHRWGIKIQTNYLNKLQKQLNQYIGHKNSDFHYYQEYWNTYLARKHQEWVNAQWAKINSQVSDNMNNNFTSIYRSDGSDTRVVRVAEISPTEEVGANVPTKSIDDGLPQTDWAQINQEQLNGNYMIYLPDDYTPSPDDMKYGDASPSYNNRVSQYNILRNWIGDQLSIRGFNTWHSALITDLQRTADQSSSANGLSFQITFQEVRLAHIKYAKNQKAPARPRKGRRNRKSKSRTIRIKPYNTFWGLSKRYGGTVSQWKRANPHAIPTDLQIGHKLNVPQGARA